MWTRSQLKEKGKKSFKANYWKAVLVALLLTLVIGGGPIINLGFNGDDLFDSPSPVHYGNVTVNGNVTVDDDDDDDDIVTLHGDDGSAAQFGDDGIVIRDSNGTVVQLGDDGIVVHQGENDSSNAVDDDDAHKVVIHSDDIDFWEQFSSLSPAARIAIIMAVILVTLAAIALIMAFDAFLMNPLEVGARNFFTSNLNRQADVKEVTTAFDHNYLSGVKTMFLRDLFTFLWSLLFIVPGIIKSYEYRMIPYLIAENPEMDYKTAFAESKQMMTGNKWNTFVLDLSFIGWHLLSLMTVGILGLFYVAPYVASTSAALYETLRYGDSQPDFASQPVNPILPFDEPAADDEGPVNPLLDTLPENGQAQ